MPTKTRKRAGGRRPVKRKVSVKVTYHHKAAAPDRMLHAKAAMAYIVFAVALAIGITAFYDAAYYGGAITTGYVVLPASTTYTLAIADGSGGSGTSSSYKLAVSTGEAIAGRGTGSSYDLTLGAMAFLSGDTTPPTCTITQSTGTPLKGATVTLTATCTDDLGLNKVTLYTNENGAIQKIANFYGSPASVSGTDATTQFSWSNSNLNDGTVIVWKAVAADSSGNEGESSTLAFTVTAVAAGGDTGGGTDGGTGGGTDTTDTTKPVVSKPIADPATPSEGVSVRITSAITDNTALASANLIVNNKVTETKTITGKSATAEFYWPAGKVGTYTIEVSASDSVGNNAKSAALNINVASGTCDEKLKPADLVGACTDGTQARTTYVCEASTGNWKTATTNEPCATSPVVFVAVGVVALAIAAAAAYYVLKMKPKQTKVAYTETPEAPATFG